jgi:plastocyanin
MRALTLAACVVAVLAAAGASAGEVAGRVTLGVQGAQLADLGPTVVFLESLDGQGVVPATAGRPVLRQRNARFDPEFMVVVAGQSVRVANDDTIFHNVFSFSRPNDFDLGVYPAGESRSVVLAHPGVVKVYCSIHESMNATMLVTPSPWHARVSASGDYRIPNVPPGRYRVTAWNERLPAVTRTLTVDAGAVRSDLSLGSKGP